MLLCVAQLPDPRSKLIEAGLRRNGLTLRWLAGRIGRAHNNIGPWLTGERKPQNQKVWGQMLEAIRDYEESMRSAGALEVRRVGVREIPHYSGIQAGMPGSNNGDVFPLEVMDWGTDRQRWARTVIGRSMENPDDPDSDLQPGDIVIFEDREWEPGDIVHAFDAGEDTVKIARGRGQHVRLVPANPDFPVLDGKRFSIKGVAVERRRKGARDKVTIEQYPHGMRSAVDRPLEE